MAMLTAVETGGEVLIHEPGWLSYPEQARLAGIIPRHVPYDADIDGVIGAITPNTGMLIINNPNNPAGRLYSREEIEALYNACHARGVYLLLDESYSDFAPPGTFPSLTSIAPGFDGALVINSLSKNLGVSGWRIGYLIGARDFIDHLLKVNQHLITCAPTFLANYCATHFDEMIAVTRPQIAALQEKRDRIAKAIASRGLHVLAGSTTFYFFLSIDKFPGSDVEFAQKLIVDDKIAVVPGSAYGASTDRFVRLSIGTETEDRIESALDAIRRQISCNEFDQKLYDRALEEMIGRPLVQ
jgi:aspartate aminotransferase/aminotransferase